MRLIGRLAGVVIRPRATLASLVAAPTWVTTWLVILLTWALLGGWLLTTDVGQQALVDERVRVVESLGGTVTDAQYAALQARPPWWVYLTSGSRMLLSPIVTVLIAVAMLVLARRHGARATMRQTLALTVHASVVLVLGQLAATPAHYVRESLTSPLNVATLLPFAEAGTIAARLFGALDLFAVWWAALLAVSLSVLTGRRVSRYVGPLAAVYLAFAAVAAAVVGVMGGD